MAGQDGGRGRKRRDDEQGRPDPPKKQSSSSRRAEPPLADYRVKLNRALEAKRLADAKREKDRASQRSLERSRSQAPLVGNDLSRKSSADAFGALPKPSGQGAKKPEMIARPPSKPVEVKSRASPEQGVSHRAEKQVAPEDGESHMAKKPASSDVVPAAAEKSSPDAGTAGELAGVHPSASEGEARGGLFPLDFSWPESLSTDKVACGELVYSIRGMGASYPDLAGFVGREAFERFARANVRSLMFANEMAADYEVKLAEAKKEAEMARKEAEEARREAEGANKRVEGMRAFNKRMDDQRQEEAAKDKGEIDRLTALVGRLQDRLRYLQAVEEPSGLVTQIRGTLGVVGVLKEKGVAVTQYMMDILRHDLKEYEAQVKAIPEVKLNPEDL